MKRISKDLVAASCIPLVLSILEDGEDYGYSKIKKVMAESNNQLEWKEGSLYPVLSKLEKNGYVNSVTRTENGRKRKYYTINKLGKSKLAECKSRMEIDNKHNGQIVDFKDYDLVKEEIELVLAQLNSNQILSLQDEIEIEDHFYCDVQELCEKGLTTKEALLVARNRFGALDGIREYYEIVRPENTLMLWVCSNAWIFDD
ncbi:MAG: PadR family transcriptional regulator PadR [Saprospiraceae bacterium]|jgi:DNA-binding PadR family transcriptional regulator